LLRRVLDDPSIAVELGAQARARALLHFTEKRMTDEHVALYEELYQAQK
jgi:glycosyltransferase involved in cell wall biosynthesis